jgi:hypothetical protein
LIRVDKFGLARGEQRVPFSHETTRRPRFSQTAATFAATSLPVSTTAGWPGASKRSNNCNFAAR